MSLNVGLGIDVGGTNTDAVLIDLGEKKVLSVAKAPTTQDDLAKGISDVLRRLDRIFFPKISLISLSTTLATNSIVEGVRRRVCGILIGYGPGDYPPELKEEAVLISGGHTVQGEEREPLDLDGVRKVLEKTKDEVEAYAVCGYFSVRNPEHELRVKRLIQEETDKPVVCGHEISLQLDAVKRATTTILNAHLIPVIHQLIDSVKRVFEKENIVAPLMIVKGDGSLLSESSIKDRPIETILSGPAASVIGANYLLQLSGEVQDAVIVDIGGTTTDIALLKGGLPRLNANGARVGSWQTNVMAIDIRTIGLGGNSQILLDHEGNMGQPLLEVKNLKKYFPIRAGIFSKTIGYVYAVDEVSFNLHEGESLGLVGESGCGKSTTARSILRLIEPSGGEIFFGGKDICRVDPEEMRSIRRDMQIVFQDPYASLDPRRTVEQIIREPLDVFQIATKKERRDRVIYLLEKVRLNGEHARRYPHEFSGGQRQRIGIARALALNPKLVIGDEPVSALDVSVQAQVINLLEDIQKEFKLSYIIIAHDLAVVEHICDRIAVMYLGRIVEMAKDKDLYTSPFHPYTIALFSAVPVPDPDITQKRIIIEGDVPSPIRPPAGCHFHTRCPRKKDECEKTVPELTDIGDGHFVACHLC